MIVNCLNYGVLHLYHVAHYCIRVNFRCADQIIYTNYGAFHLYCIARLFFKGKFRCAQTCLQVLAMMIIDDFCTTRELAKCGDVVCILTWIGIMLTKMHLHWWLSRLWQSLGVSYRQL